LLQHPSNSVLVVMHWCCRANHGVTLPAKSDLSGVWGFKTIVKADT
jgi:hypothetical protein